MLPLGLMHILGGLLVALGLTYAGILGSYALGLQRVLRREPAARFEENGHAPMVSVIVPARDEAERIERCIRSILACDYPPDLFEIIVVDDLSRDETPQLVRRLIAETAPAAVAAGPHADDAAEGARLRLLSIPENQERTRAHKKRAIAKGIGAARGSIILTTDADCVVPVGWLRAMVSTFEPDVALVSGPVLYAEARGMAQQAQALEFLGLMSVGAGAIGAGRPNLCNGANVAYRKAVFEEVGGFAGIDHLSSGDDELLMQKFAYTTPWRVLFCASTDAAVVTEGAPDLATFVQQRRRWASKGRHYPHTPLRLTIAGIYLFYVLLLAGAGAVLAGWLSPWVLALAALLKMAPEAALLWPACRHFARERLMVYFLPLQPLHVLYIVGIGAAGAFGGYTWKERRLSR